MIHIYRNWIGIHNLLEHIDCTMYPGTIATGECSIYRKWHEVQNNKSEYKRQINSLLFLFSPFSYFFSEEFWWFHRILINLNIISIDNNWSFLTSSLTEATIGDHFIFFVLIKFFICFESFFDIFTVSITTWESSTDFDIDWLHRISIGKSNYLAKRTLKT